MATDIGVLIGTQHHCHGIPAGIGTDPMLDVLITRNAGLQFHRDGIDVGSFSMKGLIDPIDSGMGYLLVD